MDTPLLEDYDSEALARWVKEAYTDAKSARTRLELLWYVNLSFYSGRQYVEVLPKQGKLTSPVAPPHRIRHVSNRIRPIIRTEYARLTSQKPTAVVVPASSEDEDLFAAYAGEQVWQSVSNRGKLQTQFGHATWWELITGNAFIKTWWDPSRTDYEGGPQGVPGDICFGHVTPFHLFVPDLREVDIQNQSYVINAYTKPLEWVKKFYGPQMEARGITINPDVTSANELMNDAYLVNVGEMGSDKAPDKVLCIEMWAKDGATDLIDGNKVIHVIGDQVMSMGEMYEHGRYPFTHFGHIPSGSFYRTSVIEDLISLQRDYNRTRSQIIEAKNRMAKPQWRYARGSIDIKKMTNEAGLGIEYVPGLPPPEQVVLQPLPNYVIEEQDRTLQDMEDISGQHDVSRGSAPPGVTAATAISYLQERDDSILSHTYTNVEEGMQDIAQQTLCLAQQYWDEQRTVKVVGDDNYFDTLMLTGSDLKNNTDIRMEGGSSLPTSKAAKQAFITDMMKMGFIPPDEGLRMLEIGGVDKLYQRLKSDESQAQRENIRMKRIQPDQISKFIEEWQMRQEQEMNDAMQGIEDPVTPPQTLSSAPVDPMADPMDPQQQMPVPMETPSLVPVNTWDNHDVHIEVHNRFRKSQAFELLSEPVRAQFEQHVQAHQAAIMMAMMEVQQFGGMGMPMDQGMPQEEQPGPAGMPPGVSDDSGPPPQPGAM